jgi:hypothetical protein
MHFQSRVWQALLLSLFAITATPANAQLQSEDFFFRVAGTGSFPVSPSELSDSYSFGRGLNAGIGVHINDSFRLQTEINYTKWSLDTSSPSAPVFAPGPQPFQHFSFRRR